MLDKNPKLPLCTLKRGNPMKNNKVMASLNPALAEDAGTREKKRVEMRKGLEGKLKKLNVLLDKRRSVLLKEIKNQE